MAALFPWRVNWLAAVATVLLMHTAVGQGQQTQPSTTQPASGQREFVEIRLRMLPAFGRPLRGPSPELLAKYNIAPPRKGPRPPFMAPRGTTNVAWHCRVTSSNKAVRGSLRCVTDGNVNAYQEDNVVELQPGLQWIQIDLEQPCEIWGILVRHQINRARAYKDVVIQVADDSDFTANVRTLFNNDDDNSSGLGKGTDQMYFDNHVGNLIEAKGIRGQYVRLYSNGNTEDHKNHCTEIEVYGLPSE